MKKPTANIILICLLGICIGLPSIAFGYGGGGGGGEGADPTASMGPSTSGGVSWSPNPNGADVMGSSIWDGRPESIHHGPYQPDKAVEDAEAELLQGFDDKTYTPDQVKEQLEWAQRVGIKLSPQALQVLTEINKPPAPTTPSTSDTSGSSQNDKQNEKAAEAVNILNALSQAVKNNGSKSDIERAILGAVAENKWNKLKNKPENKGKSDAQITFDLLNKGLNNLFGK
jgi:hypothetical protein